MKLTFHGGAGSVTGANYLLESGDTKILIDCGLLQGSNFAEKQNFEPFPYDLNEIKSVFITHAHIDHTGRLPKLVADGFKGDIYSTHPTKDFSQYLLEDSVNLLCREAEERNEEPFCTLPNLDGLKELWKGVDYHQNVVEGPFTIRFYNAGHILGSSFIEVEVEGKRIIFSGDLGNSPAPLIQPREEMPEGIDYCLIESTYGDREHEKVDRIQDALEDMIEDVTKSGGVLMIPSFAMERTQTLLYHINTLIGEKRVPKLPIFLDSPLAIKITDVYKNYKNYLNAETKMFLDEGNKLFDFPCLTRTLETQESKDILKVKPPKVIIAGSGMSQGGRIIHHEKNYLPDPNSILLFAGYQVRGSLGRIILDGKKKGEDFTVKILGEDVPVRARAKAMGGYSAHADRPQLLSWLYPHRKTLKKVFVIQGEEDQSIPFAQKVRDDMAIDAVVPEQGDVVEL
ncbi:MAG: MBL fold metallo-hydrolase [Candidatus Paceibacterota bacterium]